VIPAATLAKLSADEAMALLTAEVDRLRLRARESIRTRSRGRWPLPGPGDRPFAPMSDAERSDADGAA
jgi:hypothetical protein